MPELLGPTNTWMTDPKGCGYALGSWDRLCGKLALSHVAIEAADEDGGVAMLKACADHRAFVERMPGLVALHEWGTFCDMPGALWHWDINICLLDGSGVGPEREGAAALDLLPAI